MWRALLAFVLLLAARPVSAEEASVRLCVRNDARVAEHSVSAMRSSLLRMQSLLKVRLEFGCEVGGTGHLVTLVLREQPADIPEPSALGAAKTTHDRIEPYLELYYDSLKWILPSRLAVIEGRAMARIVAHELSHYLRQSREHGASDFLRAELSLARLMAP